MSASVRELVKGMQRELLETPDLAPTRASELLMQATALIGNTNDEARIADAAYATVLLACYGQEDTANRAKIRAETSPEYQRKREARDVRELLLEMIRSLKVYLKTQADELRMGGR